VRRLATAQRWGALAAQGVFAEVSFTNWTQPFFDGVPAPAFPIRFTGGSHTGFSDENPEPSLGTCSG
jgi:hypothetical protein